MRPATTRRSSCGPRLNCGGDLGGSAHVRSAVVAAVGGVCGDVCLDRLPGLLGDVLGAAVDAHLFGVGPLAEVDAAGEPGAEPVEYGFGGDDVAFVVAADLLLCFLVAVHCGLCDAGVVLVGLGGDSEALGEGVDDLDGRWGCPAVFCPAGSDHWPVERLHVVAHGHVCVRVHVPELPHELLVPAHLPLGGEVHFFLAIPAPRDRKSTRLNSSHVSISYAVFCLKK